MSQATKSRWKTKRTPETRKVEDTLRRVFPHTDAYRYNSASIRVRIIDDRFEGKTIAQRDAMVEPILAQLPQTSRADIMNLLMMYPDEDENSSQVLMANTEFEDPSPSRL